MTGFSAGPISSTSGFTCIRCGRAYEPSRELFLCERCCGNLQVVYDYEEIRLHFPRDALETSNDHSMWRYAPLLPLEARAERPPLLIGWTPLYEAEMLGGKLGLKRLLVKDDGRNPSASSKDRASALVIARALEENGGNRPVISCASTGNAASSLACLAAPLKLKTVIFVPERTPRAKLAQLLVFGATVLAVRGTYDDAFDLCVEASREFGWYVRNTGYNPFTREGKKTLAFELCEQLGWRCPDWVFVPVGDGNIISGLWKGFCDLHEIGFIDRLPHLAACQSEKSDAVKRAFDSGRAIEPVQGNTVADSIAVQMPRDGEAAVQALKNSDGCALSVTDGEILEAIPALARETGVFAEPAAAVTLAVLKHATEEGLVGSGDTVALVVTGNGLKDVDAAMESTGPPIPIEPRIEEVKRALKL
jgi:threonine synthase